jgi:hypothetical protein
MVAVLVVVFLSALSMHMERMAGWELLILCLIVVSVGWLGFSWVREHAHRHWNRLSKSRKRIAVACGVAIILIATFAVNRHRPNELANEFAVVVGLLLWGLYHIMSRFLDALHARLSKR